MLILGIETSCDETAVALVKAEKKKMEILSNAVFSQVKIHQKYKGIVPEIAARAHLEKILLVIKEATKSIDLEKIDLIAVTSGPGLVTSLLVGIEAGKTLSYALNKPLISVNHLEGHIYANWLCSIKEKIFPALCLIVSGGHTELVLMRNYGQYQKLGGTRDDAAGECFDKIAKLLGLGYPGGPAIETLAKQEDYRVKSSIIDLPRPMIKTQDFDFSFSGLKTAVLYKTRDKKFILKGTKKEINQKMKKMPQKVRAERKRFIRALAYEAQEAIVDVLLAKTIKAAERFKVKSVILGGGVAANEKLRNKMEKEVSRLGIKFLVPPKNLCLDNGAMIAAAGYFKTLRLTDKQFKDLYSNWQKIKVNPNLSL